MKKSYLFAIVIALLIFSAGTFVYAHGVSDPKNVKEQGQNFDYESMDQMHEEMIKQIDDPELVDVMKSRHEDCMQLTNR